MKSRKIWKTVLIALGCALGAWAFGALLLPVLLLLERLFVELL